MPAIERLGWYAARLRAMSPAELAWRTGQRAASVAPGGGRDLFTAPVDWPSALQGFRTATDRPVLLDRRRARSVRAAHPDQAGAVVAAADAVLDRHFAFFGQPPVQFPGPAVDWNLDPRTGERWPTVAGSRIDHRTASGDPKWIWELNRLQHLPWLAQAWLFTDDERYAEGALAQIEDWIRQNPPGQGISWRGGFEPGVRAISVAVALQGLRDAPALTAPRYRVVLRLLAQSASAAWRNRSRFSSANNHLVGEMAGVATVALLHPELGGADRAATRAVGELAAQADRQIAADGSGVEQSTAYQVFCTELMLVPAALLARQGGVPGALSSALQRSAEHLRVVGHPALRTGDDDGGFALRLRPDPEPDLDRHLALLDGLLGPRTSDLASAWIAPDGDVGPGPVDARAATEPVDHYAREGGTVVLRRGSRRVAMDVGPLGYLSIAAHGHADALAVTVSQDGRDVIGDPGTGSYYAEPQWREAFRGTRAHATATVDDLDQSVAGGLFLWVRHARTTVRAAHLDRGLVEAEHDGYARLGEPVRHRRYLIAPPGTAAVLVVDLFTGSGSHRLRTAWPVHPDLDVPAAATDGRHRLVDGAGTEVLTVAAAATAPVEPWAVRGDEESRLGWWSPRFESRTPAWLVGSVIDAARLPVVVASVLGPAAEPPVVVLDGPRIELGWHDGTAGCEVTIDTGVAGAVAVRKTAPEGERV